MITIDTITLLREEINFKDNNLGGTRQKINNPNEDYSLGKSYQNYPIALKSNSPIYRFSTELLLSREKLISLSNLFNEIQSEKLYLYEVGNNILDDILLTYSNTTSLKTKCWIEEFNINDSAISDLGLIYLCTLSLAEI
jgi:hypothetical protein